jgi:hypothetical protein
MHVAEAGVCLICLPHLPATAPQVHERLHQCKVTGVGQEAARKLFRQAAKVDAALQLLAGLQTTEEQILKICNGLPLALELVGGHLSNNLDPSSWQVIW